MNSFCLFNLTGCGALYVLDHFSEDISNPIKCFRCFYWPHERLLDVTWSHVSDHILWSVSGDGFIQVWDLNSYLPVEDPLSDFEPSPDPVRVIKAHQKEINSISWSLIRSENSTVLTSSSDKTTKLWDAKSGVLLSTLCPKNGSSEVNSSTWSSLLSSTFASASSDGVLRVWNCKECPDKANLELKSCSSALNTCDWSKKNSNVLVTGSALGNIVGWDIRSPSGPLFVVQEHRRAVKKIKFSPHSETVFASVSCDNSTKIFDYSKCSSNSSSALSSKHPCLLTTFKHHSDSVFGVDFNHSIRDEIVDCGRDSLVYLYSINSSLGVRPGF